MRASEKYKLWNDGKDFPKWYDKYMVQLFGTGLTPEQLIIMDKNEKLENRLLGLNLFLYFVIGIILGLMF